MKMTNSLHDFAQSSDRTSISLVALIVISLISTHVLASSEYSVIQERTSFGWLSQYSLRDFDPDLDGWDAYACVPTSSVNGMTFLQNEYGFYFSDQLTGSSYTDWAATDALLVSPAYMNTQTGFGTLADRAYYGLEAFLVQNKGFDLVGLEGMIPEVVWDLAHTPDNPPLPRPQSIADAIPNLDYIEASLAAGNPTFILLLYPSGDSGHAVLVAGLIRHADGTATLKVVDPMDPSMTYPDDYPDGDAKFTDVDVTVGVDNNGNEFLVMGYNQYKGDLPYDPTDYEYSPDNTILAALSINTRLVQDYLHSVAVAPSYFGQLPELAVRNQNAIQNQLWRRAALGLNRSPVGTVDAWASTGGGQTKVNGSSGSPIAQAFGLEWRNSEQTLLGAALHYNDTKPDWDQAGHYRQKDYSFSLYGVYQQDRWSLAGTVSLGSQDYDLTRRFQIGDNWRTHWSDTKGTSIAAGAELAYALKRGALSHGPFAQLSTQRVEVDGFTERALDNQTSTTLQVGRQTRNALIGAIGWRAFWQKGQWMPYASLALNQDFNAKSQDLPLTSWAGSELALPTNNPRKTYGSLNLGLIGQLAGGVSLGLNLDITQSAGEISDTRAMATISFDF